MGDFGTPPVVPAEFHLYDSYTEDPKWQRKFTVIWCTVLGAAVVVSIPYVVRSAWNRRLFTGLFGIQETGWGYKRLAEEERPRVEVAGNRKLTRKRSLRTTLEGLLSVLGSIFLWSAPGLGLNAGQILLVAGYGAALVACIVTDSVLEENSNRAGFIAIAQLPLVFLFATKNSVLQLLLGPGHGYEKLNFIHRWTGRGMFLAAVIHGSLWISNHIRFNLLILGQQKEGSGVAAMTLLCLIALFSARPVRRWGYEVFFIIHVTLFVAFFVTLCYHTIYVTPWIFPPLAFYGFDMLLRLFKYRIKDATLEALDQQMTMIRIPHCDSGWIAGQHIRLRVFFGGRIFESHPFSILNAPSSHSSLSNPSSNGIILAARVRGDWTKALNEYTSIEATRLALASQTLPGEKGGSTRQEVPIHVMLDGPYGGCSIDLGDYESVLLVAGGAGATFTLGLLDDIVGRCLRLGRPGAEKTTRIEFAWCIRSFGCLEWFAAMLSDLANAVLKAKGSGGVGLDLHISVFVTCLCDPDAVPDIPNMDVTIQRPVVKELLRGLVTPAPSSTPSVEDMSIASAVTTQLPWAGLGGGVAVCASGPESLTREASNAVAALAMTRGVELGGVALHTEVFSM